MKKIFILFGVLLIHLQGFSQDNASKPLQIGEEVLMNYESPHPYASNRSGKTSVVWREEIYVKNASYVAIHFDKVELGREDFLIVRNRDNSRVWKYSFSEINIRSKLDKGFWSIHVYGNLAIVEIVSKNSIGAFGVSIDKVARGFSEKERGFRENLRAICGSDNSENAICYQSSEPFAYNRSRAVARLIINGTSACTGWLIGNDGHLMTNEHCVQNASSANNLTVEFMAQGNNCTSNCNTWGGCPGTIESTFSTLVQLDANLDYALVQMPTNVSGTYGFLQLRATGAVVNERLYIPQHPQAWGKRLAIFSDSSNDVGGVARVSSVTAPRCGGSGNDVGYFADTQGGSSGSPVLGYSDNLVIALHHCANCPNRGVPIQEIIQDLGSNIPNNAFEVSSYEHIILF